MTLDEECVSKSSKSSLSTEEISRELERLLQEKADNQRVFDWVEVQLCVHDTIFLFSINTIKGRGTTKRSQSE